MAIPSNYYPLIGAAIFVVLLYLAKKRKGGKVANPFKGLTTSQDPFRSAFDAVDDKAKDRAAEILGTKLSDHKAAKIVEDFQAAFAPKPAAPNAE